MDMPARPAPTMATFNFGPVYLAGSGGNNPFGAGHKKTTRLVSRKRVKLRAC